MVFEAQIAHLGIQSLPVGGGRPAERRDPACAGSVAAGRECLGVVPRRGRTVRGASRHRGLAADAVVCGTEDGASSDSPEKCAMYADGIRRVVWFASANFGEVR